MASLANSINNLMKNHINSTQTFRELKRKERFPSYQRYYKGRKLQITTLINTGVKILNKILANQNAEIYRKNYTSWPNGVYPKNVRFN